MLQHPDMEARRFAMGELLTLSPPIQALLAGLMTWALTAAGAALVLLLRRPNPTTLDAMLAFGAGVMLAASYWSLLAPAISLAGDLGQSPILMAAAGFLSGGVLLLISDGWLSRRLPDNIPGRGSHRRTTLLISSITLHNIPEGLAIGVSFGALAARMTPEALTGAWMLALGVGLQNLPEGAAVSLPLHREGLTRGRSFFWGQASALVEPAAALVGALLAIHVQAMLPYALSFAAGAMVCVVIADLLPESQRSRCPAMMTFFALLGFTLMMVLDVALG